MLRYLLIAFLFVPQLSFAAVKISEIAWMGTKDSSSNEWIELYNDGDESVSLSGYKITSADDKLSISLKNTIDAKSYYLIERTDDTSVPDVSADLVASFGTGLSNTGETLRLLNSDGAVIDEVISGTDWKSIGGNSTTKDTPQFVSGEWITSTPTPRQASTEVKNAVETNTNNTVVSTTSSGSGSSSGSSVIEKKLRDTYRIVVHNEGNVSKDTPEKFKAVVYGLKDEVLPYANVRWNFGDGTIGEGLEVTHTYKFQGIYPIVVRASYNNISVDSKTRIEVLPQDIKIVEAINGGDGFVRIKSNNDMNISGWSLRNGGSKFVFPEGTELYSKTPTTFANMTTGIVEHTALALHRPDGRIISVFGDDDKYIELPIINTYRNSASANNTEKSKTEKELVQSASSSDWSVAGVRSAGSFPNWIYWAIAAAFIVMAGIVIYISKIFNSNRDLEDEASKYTLVEIDSNLE